jgi:hypothetical protein
MGLRMVLYSSHRRTCLSCRHPSAAGRPLQALAHLGEP